LHVGQHSLGGAQPPSHGLPVMQIFVGDNTTLSSNASQTPNGNLFSPSDFPGPHSLGHGVPFMMGHYAPLPVPNQNAPQIPQHGLPVMQMPNVGLDFPSVGSVGHAAGECKRCVFFYRGTCKSGSACQFCHLCPKPTRKKKNKNKSGLKKVRKTINQS
jgi:hypothetical protein